MCGKNLRQLHKGIHMSYTWIRNQQKVRDAHLLQNWLSLHQLLVDEESERVLLHLSLALGCGKRCQKVITYFWHAVFLWSSQGYALRKIINNTVTVMIYVKII
ncbi:hypothetical protein V8G54_021546 [Vigna mungo]|uniref:Uncharacterized protein n=1 Tax=Vigna mungo TaxID=3915 RepID=A0AAQ3NFR2_VIGMU